MSQVSSTKAKAKKKGVNSAKRAGTILSPAYVGSRIRQQLGKKARLSVDARNFLAGAMDSFLEVIVGEAMESARQGSKLRVDAKHVEEAYRLDPELQKVLGQSFIPASQAAAATESEVKTWKEKSKAKKVNNKKRKRAEEEDEKSE